MKGKRKKGVVTSSSGRKSQKRETSGTVEERVKSSQQQTLTFDLVDLDDPTSATQDASFSPNHAWRTPNRRSNLDASPISGTSPLNGKSSRARGDVARGSGDGGNDRSAEGLWVDRFAPKWEEELAVHRKKVQEVSQWFDAHFGPPLRPRPVAQSKGKGSKQNAAGGGQQGGAEGTQGDTSGKECASQQACKVLALVGPPGCGKTALVHVLAASHGVSVREWQAPVPLLWEDHRHIRSSEAAAGVGHQMKLANFSDFLRSSRLFSPLTLAPMPTTTPLQAPPSLQPSSHSPPSSHTPPSTGSNLFSKPPLSHPLSHGKRPKSSPPLAAPESGHTTRSGRGGKGAPQLEDGKDGRRGGESRREKRSGSMVRGRAGGKRDLLRGGKGGSSDSLELREVVEEKGGERDSDDEDEDGDGDEEWLPTFREADDGAGGDDEGGSDTAKGKMQVDRRGRKGELTHDLTGLFMRGSPVPPRTPTAAHAPSAAATPLSPPPPAVPSRHMLLIDDLPFVSSRQRCEALCHAMYSLAVSSHVPAIVILSIPTSTSTTSSSAAAGRGGGAGGTGGEWRQGDGVAARDVLDALERGGAHKVVLNPIARGAMHKAVAAVAAAAKSPLAAPAVAAVAESSSGDLRHAISQLQLLSLATHQSHSHTWDPGGAAAAAAAGAGAGGVGRGKRGKGNGIGKEGTESEGDGARMDDSGSERKRRKGGGGSRKASGRGGTTELVDLTQCDSDGNKGLRVGDATGGAATGSAGRGAGGDGEAVQGVGRDDPLSIFHAVGKFLYNKRLPAAEQAHGEGQRSEHEWVANPLKWQQWGHSTSQQSSRGDGRHQQQQDHGREIAAGSGGGDGGGSGGGSEVVVRHELQRAAVDMETVEVVLQRAQIPPLKLCCYLHENMLDMFHPCNGLEAAVGASAALSDALTLLSSSASHLSSWGGGSSMAAQSTGGGDEDLSPAAVRAAAAASVAARGVMFWNTQPAPKRFFSFRPPVVWATEAQMKRNKESRLELQSQCFTIAASQSLPLGSLRGSGADIATDISTAWLSSLHSSLHESLERRGADTEATDYDQDPHDQIDDIEDF